MDSARPVSIQTRRLALSDVAVIRILLLSACVLTSVTIGMIAEAITTLSAITITPMILVIVGPIGIGAKMLIYQRA